MIGELCIMAQILRISTRLLFGLHVLGSGVSFLILSSFSSYSLPRMSLSIELKPIVPIPQTPSDSDDLYAKLLIPSPSKCIRVLDIEAASSEIHDDKIVSNLRVVNLEATPKPQFTALSYVWGIEKERYAISCNSIDLSVGKNCHSALQHLRKKLGSFSIWVDAICINQSPSSNSEKDQQIPLMGEIYSGAQVTYIWLGEGNEKSDRAMLHLGRAGFLDYFQPNKSTRSRDWAAVWSLHRTLRCGKHDPVLCSGQNHSISVTLDHFLDTC
jgi:hypothetical protein